MTIYEPLHLTLQRLTIVSKYIYFLLYQLYHLHYVQYQPSKHYMKSHDLIYFCCGNRIPFVYHVLKKRFVILEIEIRHWSLLPTEALTTNNNMLFSP